MMMKKNLIIPALFCVFSPLVMAHPGHMGSHGFESGMMHPLTGLDHLSVMIGVGIMASLFGGKNRWTMPLTFISFMIVGAILGISGLMVPYVEVFIALSVVAMGVMLWSGARMSQRLAIGLVMAFAVFHGMAHGAEMPFDSRALSYFSGFVLSTAVLHLVGIGIGELVLSFSANNRVMKFIGAVVALLGCSFILS
jgi:urease accessory protein